MGEGEWVKGKGMDSALWVMQGDCRDAAASLITTQITVTRNPVARGTMTEHLRCLSERVFADFVMFASRLSSAGACNVSVSTFPLVPGPKSSSTSRSDTASLLRRITDVWPPGSFAA